LLFLAGEMDVIQAVAGEGGALPEPGVFLLRALRFFAAVFFPFDVGFGAEEAGAFFADVGGAEEGRMFMRTPSLRSGCQPMACWERGFQRTKSS
jgi:hypothetical protein